ncbi:MAG: NYN domain-containing protein [Nocardioidaceae bacterium]
MVDGRMESAPDFMPRPEDATPSRGAQTHAPSTGQPDSQTDFRAASLPATVRAKMITLASRGVGQMPPNQVPPALRKTASFASGKRAKLVGGQIADAVDSDAEFREHLAIQVKALVPDVIAEFEGDTPLDPGTQLDSAAVAYLVRPKGWADIVAAAARAERERLSGAPRDLSVAVDKLSSQLMKARAEVNQVRDKLRGQLEQVKNDNAQLRRTLGLTRQRLRVAEADTAQAAELLGDLRRDADLSARAHEAEVRRLRARIGELESEGTSAKRAARDERQAESARLRLLLDTLVEGAVGLRRELALTPSAGLPADTVSMVEPGSHGPISAVGRAMLDDDPALLRRLIELPRAHLIVDGYNVSKTAWPNAPLEQQRGRLAGGVASLVAGKGMETTIVFDGADLLIPPPVAAPRSVRVRFSPPGVIADDVIRHLVEAEPSGRAVIVVSTDRELAESVVAMGARSVASMALVRAMAL